MTALEDLLPWSETLDVPSPCPSVAVTGDLRSVSGLCVLQVPLPQTQSGAESHRRKK